MQVNIWKIICLNSGERYEDMSNHRIYMYMQNLRSCEIKAWKQLGLNRIRDNDLCDTDAVLYQLSYQASWELTMFWVRNVLVDGELC